MPEIANVNIFRYMHYYETKLCMQVVFRMLLWLITTFLPIFKMAAGEALWLAEIWTSPKLKNDKYSEQV